MPPATPARQWRVVSAWVSPPGFVPPETFAGWHGSVWNLGLALAGRGRVAVEDGIQTERRVQAGRAHCFQGRSTPAIGRGPGGGPDNFAGTQPVVLTTISRQTNFPAIWGSWIDFGKLSTVRIEIPGEPAGLVLDLVKVDTDDGPPNPFLPATAPATSTISVSIPFRRTQRGWTLSSHCKNLAPSSLPSNRRRRRIGANSNRRQMYPTTRTSKTNRLNEWP